MGKSHYSIKKRKKELARKLKQEQKRQRKLDKNALELEEASDEPQDTEAEEALDESQDKVENPET